MGVAKTTGGHVRPPPLQIFVKAQSLESISKMIGRIEIRPRADSMYHHEMNIGECQSTNGIPVFGFGGHVA